MVLGSIDLVNFDDHGGTTSGYRWMRFSSIRVSHSLHLDHGEGDNICWGHNMVAHLYHNLNCYIHHEYHKSKLTKYIRHGCRSTSCVLGM